MTTMENLTSFECKVLECARLGGRTVEDIAKEIGARVNSVSAARDRLQGRGLVLPHIGWADPVETQNVNNGHTPGPWTVPHFAKPDCNCECGYVLTDGMMGAVATVHCSGGGDDWLSHGDNPRFSEAVANAHLIAAAPDLLEALRQMVVNSKGDGKAYRDCHNKAVAAIAKATGASS